MKILTFSTPLLGQNMYIVEDAEHCIVIDPYYDDNVAALLENKNVIVMLVTHEHYDHISGVNQFKKQYGCKLFANKKCNNNLQNQLKIFLSILKHTMNFKQI